MQRQRRLARTLRPIQLDDAATREAPDAQRHVDRQRPGRDHLVLIGGLVGEAHHGPLAASALEPRDSGLDGLELDVSLACALARFRTLRFARLGLAGFGRGVGLDGGHGWVSLQFSVAGR